MFVELLTGTVRPPEWTGPSTQHLKLSDYDIEERPLAHMPQTRYAPRRDNEGERTCRTCDTTYPATAEFFYRNRRERLGLNYRCKRCHNEAYHPKVHKP